MYIIRIWIQYRFVGDWQFFRRAFSLNNHTPLRTRTVTQSRLYIGHLKFIYLSHTLTAMSTTDDINCGSGGGSDTSFGVRIASVFIILATSMSGALFPVLARRSTWLRVPKPVFEFVSSPPLSYFIFILYPYTVLPNTSGPESSYGHPQDRGFCLTQSFLDRHSVYPSPRIWSIWTRKSMFVSSLGRICRPLVI